MSNFELGDDIIILDGLDVSFGIFVSDKPNHAEMDYCYRVRIGGSNNWVYAEKSAVFSINQVSDVIGILNERMTEKVKQHNRDLDTFMTSIENLR